MSEKTERGTRNIILDAAISAIVNYLVWYCGDYLIVHYGNYLFEYCCEWIIYLIRHPIVAIVAIVLGIIIGIAWYRRNVVVIKL
jgi:hypothetical protein